jgi:hypothetical protein
MILPDVVICRNRTSFVPINSPQWPQEGAKFAGKFQPNAERRDRDTARRNAPKNFAALPAALIATTGKDTGKQPFWLCNCFSRNLMAYEDTP